MSWNGTVRCGKCYEDGHNVTSCPKMKKAWEKDPNSYHGREYARHEARKKAPKTCSYCKEQGHTRAGCAEIKQHKEQFRSDATLFRKVIVKWMKDTGLGVGALVRAQDVQYHTAKDEYMYPGSDEYVPPVGLVMDGNVNVVHYASIPTAPQHLSGDNFLLMETIGTSSLPEYRRRVALTLPCIPGIVPREGRDWYGHDLDRQERLSNINWEVVSSGQTEFNNAKWTTPMAIKKTVKEHFAREQEQTSGDFKTFATAQRSQLHDYVDGIINLSQMTDPELPKKDS
jgi:hypothetical protein